MSLRPIEKEIRLTLPAEIEAVMARLRSAGYSAYLVGGAVRDLLLGRAPKDYDVCTSADPGTLMKLFEGQYHAAGAKYGTITVHLDSLQVETTTFRKDGSYSDGRRPDSVTYSTDPADDVLRRDATINGLLYDGEVVLDYVGGLRDLDNQMVQAIGLAEERIQEDALRMLRYIRLATQLQFRLSGFTEHAIYRNAHLIRNVSLERVRDELGKILVSPDPSRGLRLLLDNELLNRISPELVKLDGFNQHSRHHNKDAWQHTLEVVDKVPADLITRLAALLHDVGKPETLTFDENGEGHFYSHHLRGMDIAREVLERLRFSNAEIERVALLVKEHMSRIDHLRAAPVKKFISRVGEENIEPLFDLMLADVIAHQPPYTKPLRSLFMLHEKVKEVLAAEEPMTVRDLNISGHDLIGRTGLEPGPIIGKILQALLDKVLETPELNNRTALLDYAFCNLICADCRGLANPPLRYSKDLNVVVCEACAAKRHRSDPIQPPYVEFPPW